jgi:hypothetical protein
MAERRTRPARQARLFIAGAGFGARGLNLTVERCGMASVPRLRRWGWGWAQGEIHAARGIRVYCALQVQGA